MSIVLSYLQSLSPVDTLPLKELALKLVVFILVVSGQRDQTAFLKYRSYGFANNCYIFQLVGQSKQSRDQFPNYAP